MNSPTLLEVHRDGATLRLRIDDLTFDEERLAADTITRLTLFGCNDVESAFALLTDAVGKPIFIDISPQETTTTVAIWVNFAADEELLTCASTQQISTAPSFADLQQRVVRLSNLYRACSAERDTFYSRITQATQRFQKEIEKASDRCERKASFFQSTRPDKATIYTSQQDVYTHILYLFQTIIDDAYRGEIKAGNQSETV